MAIETNETGTCTVITGDDIQRYRLLVLIRALELEITTGFKMARNQNTYQTAKEYGVDERNKTKRLAALKALIKEDN